MTLLNMYLVITDPETGRTQTYEGRVRDEVVTEQLDIENEWNGMAGPTVPTDERRLSFIIKGPYRITYGKGEPE